METSKFPKYQVHQTHLTQQTTYKILVQLMSFTYILEQRNVEQLMSKSYDI